MPFVTAHLEIFNCTHHPVIPESDLYFTFCSTSNASSNGLAKLPTQCFIKRLFVSLSVKQNFFVQSLFTMFDDVERC